MMNSLILWYGFLLLFAIGMGVIARREAKRAHKRT
jgi:hypothetical protein